MSKKIYEMVKSRMIEKVEEAIASGEKLPWQKPWLGHHNYVSGHQYKGINCWMLPDDCTEFLTFNQIKELQKTKKHSHIKLKKGSKSYPIVFWKIVVNEKKVKDETDEKEERVEKSTRFLLRYYNVFSINDVEGLESKAKPVEFINNEEADVFVEKMKTHADIRIVEGSSQAFFSPTLDYVQVPHMNQYKNSNEFYSTLFHELVHWSGGKTRINRDLQGGFGSQDYSKEELVAEMGSSMLCGMFGIQDMKVEDNQTAYLQSWLSAIRNSEENFLLSAATKAQKACEYLLDLTKTHMGTQEDKAS